MATAHAELSEKEGQAAVMAKTRGQARPKRQLKPVDKYDPAKQGVDSYGYQLDRTVREHQPGW